MNLTKVFLVISTVVLGGFLPVWSQPETDDKTLSPYFFVITEESGVDQLPLKSTSAEVNIAGVIADVKVTQVYKNEGGKTIEAIYIFPASTRASVYGMTMTIGERKIIAKIQEREKARKEYEEAKQAGKSASLLEQQRPNVFQMNVANILPGDVITVELTYTELLIPTDGVYEFVYPTVVGPRYSNQKESTAPASDKWVKNPYLHEGEKAPYAFDISVTIAGSMPVQDVVCSSHKVVTGFDGPALAQVKLDPSETSGGNRDFILKYRLAGGAIQTGLLLYQGEKENFFLLMLQPPKRVTPEQIPPREYIFIIDVSGSMYGFPLDISKTLMKDLISRLRPSDMFNMLLFSGGSTLLSEQSLKATPENIQHAISVMDRQRGGGGTELLPAMKRALNLPEEKGISRSLAIITDGYVTVEKEVFDLIRNSLGNANIFTFGIGSGVNRYIIEGMARVGMGEPFIVTKSDEASEKASKFQDYIQTPVLTKAKVTFNEFDVYDVEPPNVPDVLANRPVIIFGKWRGNPKGTIWLTGFSGNQEFSTTVTVGDFAPHAANSALPYLWARHKITLLSDYNSVHQDSVQEKEITRLGLTYNLLTAYTSFVAIDTQVRQTDGKSTTVQQPLPLPQGVSDYAVGGQPMTQAAGNRMFSKMSPVAPSLTVQESDEVMKTEKDKVDHLKITIQHLPEKLIITGMISKEAALAQMEKEFQSIKDCFQKHLTADIKGTAVLKIHIDGNGNAASVQVVLSGFESEPFKTCLIDLVKKWKFSSTSDGKPADIDYTLMIQ